MSNPFAVRRSQRCRAVTAFMSHTQITMGISHNRHRLAAFTDEARRDLLEIFDGRHDSRSTLVTSQLPVEHWHENLGDPTLADAILDRLVHNAHRIALTGESLRKKKSTAIAQKMGSTQAAARQR